jgi:hypothetical protein
MHGDAGPRQRLGAFVASRHAQHVVPGRQQLGQHRRADPSGGAGQKYAHLTLRIADWPRDWATARADTGKAETPSGYGD